ncbi:Inner membrane transport protein RhmT [Serratia rubidaea]|uniref:Inner membrane transport protein RhmT n=1 Tax=Serratia rubidaea TaxID=61652 RepID=A0A447QUE1_SERRU|nr:Inner membrane transport protein RhmT [Serratia rubidaea]
MRSRLFPVGGLLLYRFLPGKVPHQNPRHVYYCAALSNAIGSPISGFILNIDQGWLGLESWQLLFIIEGVPPIIIGLLIPFIIKNSPKEVGYLDVEEKAWLMNNNQRTKSDQKLPWAIFLTD